MQLERKNYSALEAPVGPYVHAVKCNGLLFVSGLTAFGTGAQKQGIANQAAEILEQLIKVASAENTDLSSLVRVTLFVTELQDIAALRAVLTNYYGENKPASSLVQVARLFSPDLLIEIEAILAVKG